MATECDRYGFFNGIYGLEQSNWANYWRGIIPDGVIALQGDQMEVYAVTGGEGMYVRVKSGQAMVDNHRIWLNTEKKIEVAESDLSHNRYDLVVIRVTYGNDKVSIAELDVKTGEAAANPVAPTPVKVTGGTYELPLAIIQVDKNVHTIVPNKVRDVRYVYKIGNDSVTTFTNNSITCTNDIEYRRTNPIGQNSSEGLIINLPATPNDTYITGVCFSSGANFSGVTFRKGGTGFTPKLVGDALSIKNKRYNLVIWWDSGHGSSGQYWCLGKAVDA